MPERPSRLRPHDVAVALQLVLTPDVSYAELGRRVGVSVGEAHNSVKRLEGTRLLTRKGRRPEREILASFLVHGVPIVFPGHVGAEARGVPTGHSGPDLSGELVFENDVVWPSPDGHVRGGSLVPLTPGAPETADDNPELYRLLCLVDALRVGGARERGLAEDLLRDLLEKMG